MSVFIDCVAVPQYTFTSCSVIHHAVDESCQQELIKSNNSKTPNYDFRMQ